MPKWQKGQSGNPDGKAMSAALRRVLNDVVVNENGTPVKDENGNDIKKLQKVAEALVKKAMDGDTTAIEQCFNRTDGKVPNVNVEVPGSRDDLVRRILDAPEDEIGDTAGTA